MHRTPEWQSARLAAIRDLTPDIRLFEIEPGTAGATNGASGFAEPTPGSHIEIEVLIGGRVERRSYSTVGRSPDGHYRIAVKRLAASRGGSAYMWTLAPGARLKITAPRSNFELAWHRPDYLLIAGGIGITPIYPMAMALSAAGAPLRLVYAARQRSDLAFADDLSAALGPRLVTAVTGEGNRPNLRREIDRLDADGECYVCGPIGLMEAARQTWAEAGRPASLLRFETFGAGGNLATQPFLARIPRLGLDVAVGAGESLLEALERSGVAMISDCRKGECGLCVLPIVAIDGPIDHRDVFFSQSEKAEGKKICTCVSRLAGGILTLDTPDRKA